jgi:hypothetical protein
MQYIKSLTFIQLVDLLAEKTSLYTTVLKDQRNTIERDLIRDEIDEIIKNIELKRDMHEITVNRG